MTDPKIKNKIDSIEKVLADQPADSGKIKSTAQSLIELIKKIKKEYGKEYASELSSAVELLRKFNDSISHDDIFRDYIAAFIDFVLDRQYDYLNAVGIYISKYIKAKKAFSSDDALNDFFGFFYYSSGHEHPGRSRHYVTDLMDFHTILLKYCPDTAFERYINFLITYYTRTQNPIELEKQLRSVLEIDDRWAPAYYELGDLYERNSQWEQSRSCYEKAIETSEYYKTDELYEKWKKVLYKLKGNKKEAEELVNNYKKYFNTKHYRGEMSKTTVSVPNVADNLEKLGEAAVNDFAGAFKVSEESSGIELFPHQQDAIRAMNQKILPAESYAGLLVLPTGGGKTLTAVYWLMAGLLDRGGKIIWIAHRHELLNQARQSFEKVCYRDIARNKKSYSWRILSGQHDKPVHIRPTDDIIIASKASLNRGLNYLRQNWLTVNGDKTFLIIDEAHHAVASEYCELIGSIRSCSKHFKMLGLTATPFRTADSEQGLLKKTFPDDIVYKIDLRELINRGILSEPKFRHVPTNVNMIELFKENNSEESLNRMAADSFFDIESIGKETAAAIANNRTRNNRIVGEYVKNRSVYKQTLVFALNVEMAIVLSGLFRDAGVRSDFVVSGVKDMATHVNISSAENELKIRKFREGGLDVLVNVNIVTEGTDLPKIQSVFLTRPTKSTILMTQMIGRALRGEKAGGTKDAYIVSFIDDWQDKIAWVNPEQLYIDENVDFSKTDAETRQQSMRLVSIAKIEEFAKIANDTVDPKLSDLAFIDRIPVGIYKFSYLTEGTDGEELDKNCDILVYDCMRQAYEEFFRWLPNAGLSDVNAAAGHVDSLLFGTRDTLLGYNKNDIIDIIRYYKQTREVPRMIHLFERNNYDITVLARYILENQLTPDAEDEYFDTEWNSGEKHWSAFFGIDNMKAFRKLIRDEKDRIKRPNEYKKPEEKPMTEKETVRIRELPLWEIRIKYPELGEKIRNAVFEKYTDIDGYYYSAQSGTKSKNRLDFQIDHIKPMSEGGLTVLENLQLLTRTENMRKGDKEF